MAFTPAAIDTNAAIHCTVGSDAAMKLVTQLAPLTHDQMCVFTFAPSRDTP